MPVCNECRVVYLEGERHVCGLEPKGAALYFPTTLSWRTTVVLFGTVAGVFWSAVPWIMFSMSHPFGEAATVFISGAVTGIAVSLLLGLGLRGRGRRGTVVFGILSYPIAVFVFGAIISVVHSLLKAGFGLSYEFAKGGFAPVRSGLYLALGALWPFALVFVPFAIWTTCQLKTVIDSKTATRALPNSRMQPSARPLHERRG